MNESFWEDPSYLKQILDNIGHGLFVIDSQYHVQYTNKAMREFSGLKSDAQEFLCYQTFEKRDTICPGCPALETFRTGEITHEIRHHTRKNGSFRDLKISSFPFREGGRMPLCILMVRDITDIWRAEQQKDDLLRMLTHDIRNPVLSAIQSLDNVTHGAYGNLRSDQARILTATRDSCDLLLVMIDDLLDIYRHEAGFFQLSPSQFDLREAIQKAVGMVSGLAGEASILIKDHHVQIPLYVRGDRCRLVRVLINLLENAIKFSPPGEQVEIQGIRRENSILVSVTDKGQGIPPEYRERIFEKYFQVEYSPKGFKPGLGIGLAFCKQTIEAHGGKIWVESPVRGIDCGSHFVFTLPVEDPGDTSGCGSAPVSQSSG